MKAFITAHPLLSYYIVTFAVSWGGMLIVIGGPGGIPATPDQFQQLLPLVALALMPGPSLTGLALTGLTSGAAGLRDVLSRLLRWRVDARWYAVALLTAPAVLTAVLLGLSRLSPEFLPPILTAPEKGSQLLIAIIAGLAGGFLEELGWTGFAIPRLRRRLGVLATGLVVGALWGAWHFLANAWSSGGLAGGIALPLFVPLYFAAGVAQLTAYRVLMVWVYDRTESLLLATLMHASLIVSTVQTVLTPAATGAAFLTWFLVLTAALWAVVAVAVVAGGGGLSRLPIRQAADER